MRGKERAFQTRFQVLFRKGQQRFDIPSSGNHNQITPAENCNATTKIARGDLFMRHVDRDQIMFLNDPNNAIPPARGHRLVRAGEHRSPLNIPRLLPQIIYADFCPMQGVQGGPRFRRQIEKA